MKAAIWFLVGFGLLLMIASTFFGGVFVLLLGLAMIAGGLFLGFEVSSHVRNIASYLAAIDKAAPLGIEGRKHLVQKLEEKFRESLSSDWISGVSSYFIDYWRKKP